MKGTEEEQILRRKLQALRVSQQMRVLWFAQCEIWLEWISAHILDFTKNLKGNLRSLSNAAAQAVIAAYLIAFDPPMKHWLEVPLVLGICVSVYVVIQSFSDLWIARFARGG